MILQIQNALAERIVKKPEEPTNQIYILKIEGDDDTFAYYVGNTQNPADRFRAHSKQIRSCSIELKGIQAHVLPFYKKHGRTPDFSFELLPGKYKDKKEALAKEKEVVQQMSGEHNILNGTFNPVRLDCFGKIKYAPEDIELMFDMRSNGHGHDEIICTLQRKFTNFTRNALCHVFRSKKEADERAQKLLEAQ